MLRRVSVSSLVPNPYRELDDYPIDRDKVDALKESISSTGFWGTIVARKVGGKYEIAFGHHRMVALQELGLKGCEIIVRELTNEQMVQMMARENLEEWGTSAYVEAQTVESTIRAYGRGEISLPEPEPNARKETIRTTAGSGGSYTMASVAVFLGWTKKGSKGLEPNHACRVAFEMLDAFESGVVTRKQLRGVKRDVAREIVTRAMSIKREQERIARERAKEADRIAEAAKRVEESKERKAIEAAASRKRAAAQAAEESAADVAKSFAEDAVKQIKSGNWSQRDVREAAAEEKARLRSKREQRIKEASQYYGALTSQVSKMLNDETFDSLRKLLDMDCGLEQDDIDRLKAEVDALAKRASKFSGDLAKWQPPAPANAVEAQLRIVG